jgi:hypothetical protein
MHKKNEFIEMKRATDSCKYLADKYASSYKAGATVDDVATVIASIRDDFHKSGFIVANTYTVVTNYFAAEGTKECSSVSFTVKPTSKAAYNTPAMKSSFSIVYNDKFFATLIDGLASWFDKYNHMVLVYDNLAELNDVFATAVQRGEIPFTVAFDLGEGIIDASDTSIVLGIAESVLTELALAPAFSDVTGTVRDAYIDNLADFLKGCPQPYTIVKQNNNLIKPLGVFSRRTIKKLLRENVATRRIEYTRTGTGFYGNDDYFCVISKVCVTDEAAEAAKKDGKLVIKNNNPTKSEAAANLNNILVTYKISPFNDLGIVEKNIADVPGVLAANK